MTRFTEEEMTIFTRSEREDRKYTIGQAVASAQRYLNRKCGIEKICVNAVPRHAPYDSPITLVELNRISSTIISDTCYHAVESDYFPNRRPSRS